MIVISVPTRVSPPASMYERHVGAQIDRRIEEFAHRGPSGGWIRYPATSVRVVALALAWTRRAVMVEWSEDGSTRRLWVWASAVEIRAISPGG
ncbi:hypothetical protein C5C31_14725 [Rathayibacter rathayi]|nr:hypothetical protein C5C02_14065 [Rathayibacter rathayi]PPG74165.1 hypothetical protein C5C23_13770 [Rathayibacter rathayi]PPH17092.1 hypothetical protein C5C31_14725 [Rathayibacter rathayi]PPI76053.1 hypothetical protein C5E03_11785 [Rathayibacter rathayi]